MGHNSNQTFCLSWMRQYRAAEFFAHVAILVNGSNPRLKLSALMSLYRPNDWACGLTLQTSKKKQKLEKVEVDGIFFL